MMREMMDGAMAWMMGGHGLRFDFSSFWSSFSVLQRC